MEQRRRSFRELSGDAMDIGEEVAHWLRAVDDVVSGYWDTRTIYDYDQSLMGRSHLERRKAELSDEFLAAVQAADERFRTATHYASKTRLSGDYWWEWRLPDRAGPEFRKDARMLGLEPPGEQLRP